MWGSVDVRRCLAIEDTRNQRSGFDLQFASISDVISVMTSNL